MSERSSESSGPGPSDGGSSVNSDTDGLEKLCLRIHRKLSIPVSEPLATAEHTSAVGMMLKARDIMVRGAEVSQNSKTCIVCSGVACMKRIHSGVESDESMKLLNTTVTLLFTLLVICESSTDLEEDMYEEPEDDMDTESAKLHRKRIERDDEQLIAAWMCTSLADIVLNRDDAHASSWGQLMRSDISVSRAALREARYVGESHPMETLAKLANVFFRCSSSAMVSSMMATATATGGNSSSFLTLDTVGMMNDANNLHGDKLASIVDSAESEAGQAVFRDLILSFKLPQHVVGVRRVLMLSREANASATKDYTEILNSAHDAAMRGANWSWEQDPDPVHKMCALLAGLAIVLAKTPENIRKGDAFAGRVLMPFIECSPPRAGVMRMALVPSSAEWTVFSTNESGKVRVRCSDTGFDGMCSSTLLFCKSVNV